MFLDTHVYGVPSTLIEENIDNERVIFDVQPTHLTCS